MPLGIRKGKKKLLRKKKKLQRKKFLFERVAAPGH